jgi:hypothetical protein
MAATLGVVLISRHHVLIGAIIATMAVVRAVLLVAVRRRRSALRAAFRARRGGRFGPMS